MSSRSESGKASFAVRLFVYFGTAYLALLVLVGWLLLRIGGFRSNDRAWTLTCLVIVAVVGLAVIRLG